MSEHDLATLAGPCVDLTLRQIAGLQSHLPEFRGREPYDDGYLDGLTSAARLLEDRSLGPAAAEVRALLAVAADRVKRGRAQLDAIRAEVNAPEYRAGLEEEARRMFAGEIPMRDFDDLLARMDEKIARAGGGA